MIFFAAKQLIQSHEQNKNHKLPDQRPFVAQPYKEYKIVLAQMQNKAIQSSGDPNSLFKAILWSYHGGANQRWILKSEPNGRYSIYNAQSGGTLQIPDHSNGQKGTQVHVSQPNNTINQKWVIVPARGGYAIKSAQNDLGLNVYGGLCNDGDKIALWPFDNCKNQVWLLLPIEGQMGPQQVWGQQQQQWGQQQQQWGQPMQPMIQPIIQPIIQQPIQPIIQPVQPVIVLGGQQQPNFGQQQSFGQGQQPFGQGGQPFGQGGQQPFGQGQQPFGQGGQQPFGQGQQPFVQSFGQNQQTFGMGQQGFGQGLSNGGFYADPNRQYKIVLAQMQTKAIDSAQTTITIQTYLGIPSQKWRIFSVPNEPGKVTFLNSQNGGSIEIPEHSRGEQGSPVIISHANNTINEKWQIVPANGGYSIRSAMNYNFGLNALGGNCYDGDKVGLWPFGGYKNETWTILPA